MERARLVEVGKAGRDVDVGGVTVYKPGPFRYEAEAGDVGRVETLFMGLSGPAVMSVSETVSVARDGDWVSLIVSIHRVGGKHIFARVALTGDEAAALARALLRDDG